MAFSISGSLRRSATLYRWGGKGIRVEDGAAARDREQGTAGGRGGGVSMRSGRGEGGREKKNERERERERKEKCIMKILELIIAVKVGQEIPVRSSSTGARYSLKASDA